jgi:hypothetical protein
MAMHSLTKSSIFFAVGHVAQAKGTQRFAEIRGLSVTHPRLSVAFALAVLAIAGLPPFGVFTSEFLILTTTFARAPWLALLPAFGLLVGFGALILRLQDTIFGEPIGPRTRVDASSVPIVLHLMLVLAAGPLPAAGAGVVVPACRGAARMSPPRGLAEAIAGRQPGPDGFVRLEVDGAAWEALAAGCAAGRQVLSGAVGRRRQDAHGLARQRAWARRHRLDADRGRRLSLGGAASRAGSRLERRHARSLRHPSRSGWTIRAPGSITDAGPAGRTTRATLPAGRRRGAAPDPGRAGPCRHHRARSFPLHRQRRDRWCGWNSGWAMSTRASSACWPAPTSSAARGWSAASRATARSAYAWAFARAVEAALGWPVPPRAVLLRAVMAELERMAHHISDVGAVCNDASVLAVHAHCALQREDVLATSQACFGHRLMMDRNCAGRRGERPVGGGHRRGARAARPRGCDAGRDPAGLRFDALAAGSHRHHRHRPAGAGAQYAAGGFVGRAAGRAFDARASFAYAPYDALDFALKTRTASDVDARLMVRLEEIEESLRLTGLLLDRLVPGPILGAKPAIDRCRRGGGAGRGVPWRCVHERPARFDGTLARVHARDASWFNGRCWKPRSRATSLPTSRCATSRSTVPTRGTTCEIVPARCPCSRAWPRSTGRRRRRLRSRRSPAPWASGRAGGSAARCRSARSMPARAMAAELEIHALNNPVYDVERFGLKFVASPRHADVLLVTGPVTWNMR